MGNKYIYQNIKVGRAGVSFKINGTAKSNSVPLSNENRTFGIALNIYYNNSSTPEFHYQNFSADTYAYQQVSLSVTPEKTNEVVNYIAFAFVYGYNENEMTVDNAEVNISPIIQSSKDSKNETSEKEAVDEEVLSESIDKSKPYIQTSSEYDSTGNYVTSETNEQGSTTKYSYDANGNPLTYRDGMSMTWKNGRQLATLTNGDTSISYGYDSGSVRTTKTVNGVKYTYAYLNGQLLYETRGDAKFYYSYDANGILYNVRYTLTDGGTEYSYYYTHNSRGDIVGIYNGAGELKAHYEYDAWGNVISITDNNGNAITSPNHIGNLNPFRYRGYYQDTETGLYYLMSRYYDAVTHRFINADGYFQAGTSILDGNTFAYCANNPVSHSDTNGNSWFSNIVSTVMGMLLNVVKKALFPFVSTRTSTTSSYNNNYKLIPKEHSAINFSTGIKTTTKTSTEGYSPGLISCSYNQDAYTYSDNASGLSAGVTNTISVNAFIFGAGVNFGDDGWGLDFSINLGNTSFYASYNKHNPLDNELQIGYTMWDKSNSSSVSNYVSGSVNSFKLSPAVAATLMFGPVVGLAAAAVI